MGWNGSGIFTRSYDWTNERDAGYKIDAAKFDTENDNFATGINACLAKNGENAATGDLSMGGYIHTGVGDATALTHYPSTKQVQWGRFNSGGTSGGSANAQTITLDPAPESLSLGMTVTFTAGFTNTGACTLNPNSLGATAIQRHGLNLVGGEIIAGRTYTVVADGGVGTTWRMVNDVQMGAAVSLSTPQAISTTATAAVELDDTVHDPDSLHSEVVNPERVLVPISGLWQINANVTLAVAPSGSGIEMWVALNGTTSGYSTISTGQQTSLSGMVYATAATDYVAVYVKNNELGTINIANAKLSVAFIR